MLCFNESSSGSYLVVGLLESSGSQGKGHLATVMVNVRGPVGWAPGYLDGG